MAIKHLVEIGRVAYVSYGRNAGRPVAIVDVIDQNRALVDGPCSKVKRQPIRFKRLRLTKYKINLEHSASSTVVEREWKKNDIDTKWKSSIQFKRLLADKRRKDLSDLGRFKVYKLKQKVNKILKEKVKQLKFQEKKQAAVKKNGEKKNTDKKKPAAAAAKPAKAVKAKK